MPRTPGSLPTPCTEPKMLSGWKSTSWTAANGGSFPLSKLSEIRHLGTPTIPTRPSDVVGVSNPLRELRNSDNRQAELRTWESRLGISTSSAWKMTVTGDRIDWNAIRDRIDLAKVATA